MNYIENYQRYLAAIGYQQTTITHKTKHLSTYLNYAKNKQLNILEVTSNHIKSYHQYLAENKAHNRVITRTQYMVTLRQFYHWMMELGYLEYHPFGRIKLAKDPIKKQRTPIPEAKVKCLYKATETPDEKLLLILGYGCGMRSKEILQLQVRDIKYDKAVLIIRHSKYNKRRVIPLQPISLQYLRHYIIEKNIAQNSHLITVSYTTLLNYFKNIQKRLDWLPPYYSLHHLRHSIASHLVDRGLNLQLVQHFLGHSSLQTTQIYVTPIKDIQLWKTT